MPENVEFAIKAVSQGRNVSPAQIPFGLMKKFHEDVERLVFGSNQGSLTDVVVGIREGSYALVVPIPESVKESFNHDMGIIAEPDAPTFPDPVRLQVLEQWQRRSVSEHGTTAYFVRKERAHGKGIEITIDSSTKLHRAAEDVWVETELLLLGEVREAGGEKANIHVKIRDQKIPVIVSVSPSQLKNEPYPLFNQKLLRVKAERNLRTKKLRKLRLINFVPYKPEFDESAFTRMTEAGQIAWAGVGDASEWVRNLRG